MSHSKPSLLSGVTAEIAALGGDLRALAVAHLQLARLEIESDVAAAKRLAIVLAAAGLMALVGLPLLAVCAADLLDGRLGIARAGWLAIFGFGLLSAAAIAGYAAWRRFRGCFTALEQTRAELREHLEWLREWLEKEQT